MIAPSPNTHAEALLTGDSGSLETVDARRLGMGSEHDPGNPQKPVGRGRACHALDPRRPEHDADRDAAILRSFRRDKLNTWELAKLYGEPEPVIIQALARARQREG